MTEATKLPPAPGDEEAFALGGKALGGKAVGGEAVGGEAVHADGLEAEGAPADDAAAEDVTVEEAGGDGAAGDGAAGDDAVEADLETRWRDSATSMAWQPPAQRRHRRRTRLVAGLVIVVALAAFGYGGWRVYNDDQLASARSSALAAGKADAALISTYSYKTFPAYSKKIVANSTKQFANNYTKDAASLGTILTQYQAGSKGNVIGAGLGPGTTTSKATVYVFLNETVSNSKNPSESERARMVVTLVRHSGHWIIANAVVE